MAISKKILEKVQAKTKYAPDMNALLAELIDYENSRDGKRGYDADYTNILEKHLNQKG
jgi:hypothetical protein